MIRSRPIFQSNISTLVRALQFYNVFFNCLLCRAATIGIVILGKNDFLSRIRFFTCHLWFWNLKLKYSQVYLETLKFSKKSWNQSTRKKSTKNSWKILPHFKVERERIFFFSITGSFIMLCARLNLNMANKDCFWLKNGACACSSGRGICFFTFRIEIER